MLGFLIGLAAGAVHFYALSRFTKMVTGGEFTPRLALFGVVQFLIPLAVLVVCAFTIRDLLLWVAIGMAVALVGSAVIKFALSARRSKGRDTTDD